MTIQHAVFVQCDDGGYINAGKVYRWSIDEDVTNQDDPFTIKAHFGGPQHPIPITTRSTKDGAQSTLDNILRTAAWPIPGGRSLDQPAQRRHDE